MLVIKYWVLGIGQKVLGIEYLLLSRRHLVLDTGYLKLGTGYWVRNIVGLSFLYYYSLLATKLSVRENMAHLPTTLLATMVFGNI